MARRNSSNDEGYESYGFATEYLTPDQRIREEQLAPQRLMEASMAAHRAGNPLVESAPSLPVGAPSVTVPAPAPNPLTRPPVPLSVMGTDQQIKWQQLEDTQRQNQLTLETGSLDADIKRQNLELRAEQIRQNRGLAAEIPKLREALNRSPEEYQDLKADLTQRFPIGMGSPESDRILGEYEKIFTKTEGVKAQLNQRKIEREEANRLKREDTILKQAWEQGPEVAREIAARLADPLKGADDASKLLAQVQERNTARALEDTGLSKEVIAQRYGGEGTGRPFDYQAARAAPKSRASLSQERNKAGSEVMALEKMRAEAELMGTWSEDNQQILDEKRAYWKELTPQIGDRAGVQGFEEGARPSVLTKPVQAPVTGASAVAPAKPREKIYRNPATGKRIALRNGKWEEI